MSFCLSQHRPDFQGFALYISLMSLISPAFPYTLYTPPFLHGSCVCPELQQITFRYNPL